MSFFVFSSSPFNFPSLFLSLSLQKTPPKKRSLARSLSLTVGDQPDPGPRGADLRDELCVPRAVEDADLEKKKEVFFCC